MAEQRDQSTPPEGSPPRTAAARHRRAHTTARDLERYAGLFAHRTRVMRSSAMRGRAVAPGSVVPFRRRSE